MKKILYIILDGLGDRPIKELNNLTPLEAADTPHMNFLAENGLCGMQNMLPKGVYPTSEECHLALFGYDYKKDYPGRGVLEALGAGIELGKNDIAFRINIGTVDENEILVDPHAGGVESIKELTDSLQDIEIDGIRFDIYPTLEHRGVLVLRSDDEIGLVSDTDPHKTGDHEKNSKILMPIPIEKSKGSLRASKALRQYQEKTFEILKNHTLNKNRTQQGRLPCNFILTRGAGRIRALESFEKKNNLKAAAVAGAPLYKGVARYLGMDLFEDDTFTGKTDTNLNGKVKKAIDALSFEHDFVYLHIKGTDSLAEDLGDYNGKKEFIEKIDRAFEPLTELKDVIIMITGDHTTACEVKDHVLDPVPFLIFGSKNDNVKVFGETACKEGALGHIIGVKLIDKVFYLSRN